MESKNANTTIKKSIPKDILCIFSLSEIDTPFYLQLKQSLKLWERQGHVRWMDEVLPGSKRSEVLHEQVKHADLILLLLSPDFFADDQCYQTMEQATQERPSSVISILVREANWRLSSCKDLPIVPHNEQPVASWTSPDEAYATICADLARLLSAWHLPSPGRLMLFQVPKLPSEEYVPRPEVFRGIKSTVLEQGGSQTRALAMALRGAGGIGKTTLALAICHDPDIQAAFPDGILWITLGEHPPKALDLLNHLLDALERVPLMAITLQEAQGHWEIALRDRRCLLVIDDIWQADALLPLLEGGLHCVRLITTRNDQLLRDDTQRILVDAMKPHEALTVLCRALPVEIEWSRYQARLTTLTEWLGCWPLLLRLANAMLVSFVVKHHKSPDEALTTVEEAYQTRGVMGFRLDNVEERQRTMNACLGASIEHLKQFAPSPHYNVADCYQELAIFPEDDDIPIATLEILWGLPRQETETLCLQLYDLSLLLMYDLGKRTVRLHDVMHSYLVQRAGTLMPTLHIRLLRAYWQAYGLKRWAELPPNDRYIWLHLILHLCQTGHIDAPTAPLTDLGYLTREALYAGVSALEADLQLASTCFPDPAHSLFASLSRTLAHISHLLRQAHGPAEMGGLLLSYLGQEPAFVTQRDSLERELPRPFLTAWHALPSRSSSVLLRTLQGHTFWVNGCAVSNNGRVIVSASHDETLKVWDAASGEVRLTLSGHTGPVLGCAVSPDGRFIVSASWDRTLKVWETTTGKMLLTLDGHGSVLGCAVSPNGSFIVSTSNDSTLKVWDVVSGKVRLTLNGHTEGVSGCAVSFDGRFIVSASWDRTLKVWETTTGTELRTLHGHTDRVRGCTVSPDGRFIVSASDDRTLKVWDAATGTELRTLYGHTGGVSGCAMSPDGRIIISASEDMTLKVWDAATGAERRILSGHGDWVRGCAVSADGRFIVSSSSDKTLKVWDAVVGAEHVASTGHTKLVTDCAVSSDGCIIISASEDMTLKVWDAATGREQRTLNGHALPVTSCTISPNGRMIVSASVDQTLKVWDVVTGKVQRTLQGHMGDVLGCAMSSDGRTIVSASYDQTLKVWNAATGKVQRTLQGHRGSILGCAISPDGRFIVSASRDATLIMWDMAKGTKWKTLIGHAGWVTGCAVSPNGQMIVSTSADMTLKMWEAATGRECFTLRGHKDDVLGCAVSPDGRFIVSASRDKTLKVWESQTGQCLLTFPVDGALSTCAFHPDGKHLVACGMQGMYFLRLVM